MSRTGFRVDFELPKAEPSALAVQANPFVILISSCTSLQLGCLDSRNPQPDELKPFCPR
jgi:hypothetical protein